MASSGSFTTSSRPNTGYPRNATFSWSQASQSIDKNQTTINWSFTLGGSSSSTSSIAIYGGSITVNGETKSFNYANTGYKKNGFVLASGSTTITHGSDGKKTFSASGGVNIYGSSEYYSGSGSWALNDIPRAAEISTAPNFNDEDNPTITYSNPAGNSVASLDACISLTGSADDIAYRAISKTGTSYTFNLTDAERNVLRNATTTSKTRTVKFFIRTIIGNNTYYKSKDVTLTIVNGEPTFSNFTFQDTNSTTTTITGNNQYIIQNKSTLRATITAANKATAVKGASMVDYTFAIGSYSGTANYSSSDINKDIGTVNASTNQTLSVTAKDSRGFTKVASKTVNIVPYSAPTISASVARDSNFEDTTRINISGSMALLKVNGTTKNAVNGTSGIQYRYKQSTSSTWGSWTNVANTTAADGTISTSQITQTFNKNYAYDFQFKITDKLETTTINATLAEGQPQFFIGSDGRSSVGGLPAVSLPAGNLGQLEVYGDVYSKGNKLVTFDEAHPIGEIFMTTAHSTSEAVAAAVGGGTWQAWGAGRVPVGIDTGDSDFDTVEETGGEKTHQLTTAEMPSHTHNIKNVDTGSGSQGKANGTYYNGGWWGNYQASESAGGNGAHNNLQPYITVYMWKRTA